MEFVNNFVIEDGYGCLKYLSNSYSDANHNFDIIKKALNICNEQELKGIKFPKGSFPIYNEKSEKLYSELLSGRVSATDYEYWNSQNNTLVNVSDVEKFSVCGDNTVLIANGLMGVFCFKNIKAVNLNGVTIDWKDPPFFTAEVLDIESNKVYIKVLDEQNRVGGEPIVSFQNYDLKTGNQKGMCVFCGISNLKNENDGTFSFESEDINGLAIGDGIIARYIYSFKPIIHFYECEDVKVTDVTLHAGSGMGIIAHKCKNVTVEGFKDIPSNGRPMSSNVDATHFISCYGKIYFKNCEFEGMGDDALNVHGFYQTIKEIVDEKTVVTYCEAACQDGILDFPDSNDKIEFIKRDNLLCFAKGEIAEIYPDLDKKQMKIIFKDSLPEDIEIGMLLGNVSKTAELLVENCKVRNIRGRAMLIQNRNTVIKNNFFEHCTGQGVHIDTADGWMEAIGTQNITIENNKFIDCGYGITKYCDAVGIVVETEAKQPAIGVHKNIVIKGNYIKGKNIGIKLRCAENILLSGNVFDGCEQNYAIDFCKNFKMF